MQTLYNGKHSTIIEVNGKEMIKRVPASAMLAIDREGYVIMVEQDRGSFGKLIEVPAGKVEFGEDPLKTAERELMEETGYKANNIKHLIDYFPSVGYSTEQINCYYSDDIKNTGIPHPDDGEEIRVVNIYWKDLLEMIQNGEIKDSKTIMCVLAYEKMVGF